MQVLSLFVRFFLFLPLLFHSFSFNTAQKTYLHHYRTVEAMNASISTANNVTADSIKWATNSRKLFPPTRQQIELHLDRQTLKERKLLAIHYFDYQPRSYSTYLSQRRVESIKSLVTTCSLSNVTFHAHHVFLSRNNRSLNGPGRRRIEYHWDQ